MAFFTFGKKYKTFEEWYATFTGTGLKTVVNKNSMIVELATKYLDLFTRYLNLPTPKEHLHAKLDIVGKILSLPSFLPAIPDLEKFAKSLNTTGAETIGVALNPPAITQAIFVHPNQPLLNHLFFTGLGTNIEPFLRSLQYDAICAIAQAVFSHSGLQNIPLAKNPAEWARGLGPNAKYFFANSSVHPTASLMDLLLELGGRAEEFGAALAENAAPLANMLFNQKFWHSSGVLYNRNPHEIGRVLHRFFAGLAHNITPFVDALTTEDLQSTWLVGSVPPPLCLFVAQALKTPERCEAFGLSVSYTHSLYGAAAPDFIRTLGKNATPLMNGLFSGILQRVDRFTLKKIMPGQLNTFYFSIGTRANEFVGILPVGVRTIFIQGLSNELVTPELIGAMKCPFCHQELESTNALLRCSACSAFYHNECAADNHNHCATLGCDGNLVALRRPRPGTTGPKK